jgi:hypothetical protein
LSRHIPTLADVLEARRNIAPHLRPTPLFEYANLDELVGAEVHVKFSSGANWGVTTGVSDLYAKTATWTFTSGASATLTFYGTKVWLYAAKAFDQAIMSLSLDGGTAATIDNYPAT